MQNLLEFKNLNEGVSVVIVTLNGKERIKPTLEHLANQKNIDFPCEILLVDNNSKDDTIEISKQIWTDLESPFTFRTCVETRPGTMFARKKGLKESYNKYVLFCDDDNWLCTNYLKVAYEYISKTSKIAAVGGKGIIEYEKYFTPPEWIKRYEGNYATGAQGREEEGDTTNHKGCLYSAGMIVDKKWLNKLYSKGFTSSLKGRDGKSLQAGEDTELTMALKLIGGKLHYSPLMEFNHFMPANRINWSYLKRMWRSFGYSDFLLSPYYNGMKKKYFRSLFKKEFYVFKEVLHLSFKLWFVKVKQGDHRILDRERKIGELQAFFFDYSTLLSNRKQVKKISIDN